MVYVGSKNRIAKYLVPIITKDLASGLWYVEPFVGGANMIDKIDHPLKIGADSNKYLIALLKYVQNGGDLPDYITKEQYQTIKANPDNYPNWFVGYCAFICSFRGKYFGGFSGICGTRNYQNEKRNNLLKQNLGNIDFRCSSYENLEIPDNAIIYCDPPYNDVTQYSDKFDSDKFWEWCREMSKNHQVYISEYNAPSDFRCIWQIDITSSLSSTTSKKAQEKLFVYEP